MAVFGPLVGFVELREAPRLQEDAGNVSRLDKNSDKGFMGISKEEFLFGVFLTYDWSKKQQEIMLFAFFVGYTAMMLPMGIIAQKINQIDLAPNFAGPMMGLGNMVANLSGLAIPFLVSDIVGDDVTYDWSKPVQEMILGAFFVGYCLMMFPTGIACQRRRRRGTTLGTVIAFQLSGLLASSAAGWPSTFWVVGSGFLSSLPYIGSFFFCIAYGVLSDYCVNRGYVTLKTTRIVCNTLDKPKVSIPSSYGYGMRHVQSCLLFLCVTVAYMARAHLGVSVVAMTRPNDKHNTTNIIDNNETAIVNVKETGMELNATGEIIFKNESMDVDETSFHNFIISHGERISEYNNTLEDIVIGNGTDTLWNVYRRLGGKIPIQIGLLVNGIISIVTPTVAVWGGWKAVCACRVLQGVSTTLGTVIAFQLSGLLASSAAGWPSTFWVVGVTCLVAFAMVTLFSAATPSDHKTISEEEKKYIMGAAGSSKTSGFLSSLPYIGSFFFCIAYGVLSDYCVNRGYVTLKTTRIVCNTLAVSYTDNITLAVILIVAAVSLYAGVHSGWMVNYIDMSPNFSGSLMAVGNTGCGAGVLLLPVLVSNIVTELGGWVLTVIFRIIQGLSQSCIVPSMHTAFGKWTPLEERGRLTSFAYGGQALGTVLGMPITGFIAASPLGWPGIFRFYGLLSGLKHLPVPWKKLMRSWGLYAIVVAHTGYNWGNLTLYSEVPAFMDKIMKVNIKANGLLTALPYFVQWFSNFFFSWVTDMIIVKKYLSVTNTRKLANSIGSISSTIGLITLAFVDKDIYVVETILVTICAFSISTNVGYHVNHIDIAPNFAGTLMSISNFVSNCVGSLAPIVAGCILTDVTSEYLWRKVFCVSAGFFFVTNLFYVIFGTAELADWNEPEEEVTKEDEDPMLMKERR
ncbi:hypothetical protein MSG28_010004 [Choristoneura fumiferana]|uniref:Uncharacterized protein n=1 Tax=Choristoneura fumiferana TaxID=7141 RepID=A0ACC0KJ76_CHOFU|nr:hypothetical protein MSG28_010004 [Choristoneura fumiferana]